jgi:hypothetical protein
MHWLRAPCSAIDKHQNGCHGRFKATAVQGGRTWNFHCKRASQILATAKTLFATAEHGNFYWGHARLLTDVRQASNNALIAPSCTDQSFRWQGAQSTRTDARTQAGTDTLGSLGLRPLRGCAENAGACREKCEGHQNKSEGTGHKQAISLHSTTRAAGTSWHRLNHYVCAPISFIRQDQEGAEEQSN